MKKDSNWNWTEEYKVAVGGLRQELQHATEGLPIPDAALHFSLDTDASTKAVATVLMQAVEQGELKVVQQSIERSRDELANLLIGSIRHSMEHSPLGSIPHQPAFQRA